jgi:iron-sulfur cluster assembly protein
MSEQTIMSVTDAAISQVKILISKREKESLGIRVGVKSGGCSGLSYYIEYADEISKFDETIQIEGITILIDPKALMYLIGSKMDYVIDEFKSGFIFLNPNEKGKCGCGKSFSA